MSFPDWREAGDYVALAELDAAQWAWEFLRRNPDYQRDYAWFMTTWQALEADYGKPPQRDFHRWRQDARAWHDAKGTGQGDEALLIECWMAERWGLSRFPLDPARSALQLDDRPAWHAPPPAVQVIEPGLEETDHYHVDLRFDSRVALTDQLEAARRLLLARQHRLRREGILEPASAAPGPTLWTLYLRLLDAESVGVSPADAMTILKAGREISPGDAEALLARAEALRDRDYRFLVVR